MTSAPLLTLGYTLAPADALAYETLRRELVGWRKWLLLVWLGGAAGLVAFLPPDWVGPEWGWRFWLAALLLVGVAYALATAVMTAAAHLRARRRLSVPVAATLAQWGDHLEATLGGRPSFVAYETIANVVVGQRHVFVQFGRDVLIVPERAFGSHHDMVAFGEEIDRLSREAAH